MSKSIICTSEIAHLQIEKAMLYYLFNYLSKNYSIPGVGVFQYITFRMAMAVITSLLITTVYGRRLIDYLRFKQVGETVRNLGLEGQMQKSGTPTMGGIIILLGILIPTLLFAKLENVYVILMIITTVWLGAIGFLDDYIKVFKKNKEGLAGRFKIIGQVGLSLIVGWTMYFNSNIIIRQEVVLPVKDDAPVEFHMKRNTPVYTQDVHSTKTTMPFYKNNEFDYGKVLKFLGKGYEQYALVVFLFFVIIIITFISNGANITDGIDGLATGTSAIIGITLAILAYVSGNTVIADYLNIMYIPNSGELVIFAGAFVGACVGFLWYNSYPAQVFMGDTGSLAIGGIIAVFAIMIRKELMLPLLCGIFLVENFSVIIQVSWFKYTKKKFGEGRRVFLMAPLHHHYQKKGFHEAKIVTRFWIICIILAIVTVITLKLR
ncbi:Phospho-N-acetylmuramoyl-pentapeptide-transferase [Mucilaginibacter sp. NFR10]|nr:Phospho-N-acetylmuramoyl-pentapeptide-transferase [Mucilaginibacter sp. NFR10]